MDSLFSPLDARRDDLTAPEVAALLGQPLKLIAKYARQGDIPGAYKLRKGKGGGQGSRWMFKRKQLEEWWIRQTSAEPIFVEFRKKRKLS